MPTPRAATHSDGAEGVDDVRAVVEGIQSVERLLRRYGLIGLTLLGVGGGGAIFTIPRRLAKVEADHRVIMRRQDQQIRTQNFILQQQDYTLCVMRETLATGGDVRLCRRPHRSWEEEADSMDLQE